MMCRSATVKPESVYIVIRIIYLAYRYLTRTHTARFSREKGKKKKKKNSTIAKLTSNKKKL